MTFFSKVSGAVTAGMALLAMSGTASALTYQGAEFSASASGAEKDWTLTIFMDFTGADSNNEFLGDWMESWSFTLPETATLSMVAGFDPAGWKLQTTAQADASGCGKGAVPAVCADFGTINVLDGYGPLITDTSKFAFTVDLTFASAVNLEDWTGNFHLLSVRLFDKGCGQEATCIKKDGGLISQPLSVPEPGSLALLGLGLIGLGLARRRRA